MNGNRQADRDTASGQSQVDEAAELRSSSDVNQRLGLEATLTDIREAGRSASNPTERANLQWDARRLGDAIWQLCGEYPQTKIKAFEPPAESGTQTPLSILVGEGGNDEASERPKLRTNVYNAPFSHNPYFTGRDSVLHTLDGRLAVVRKLAICGLSGVGKTQVAAEYICRYQNKYSIVLWADGSSKEKWQKDFQKIAYRLNLPEKRALELSKVCDAVWEWLSDRPDYLLVLDGVQDFSEVAELMRIGGGYVLATTENSNIGDAAWPMEIGPMNPDEGLLFLLRRATMIEPSATLDDLPPHVLNSAREIVEKMGGLPLALDQAGAYIKEFDVGLDEYLRIYARSPGQLLDSRGASITGSHGDSVAETINMRLDRLAANEETAVAERFLKIVAFFDERIPDEILGRARALLQVDTAAPSPSLRLFRSWLQRYSLIDRDPTERISSIHPLVQKVVRNRMSVAERAKWTRRALQAVDGSLYMVRFWTYRDLTRYRRIAPCAALLVDKVSQIKEGYPQAGRFLCKLGAFHCQEANYVEATRLYNLALDFGPGDTCEKALALKGLAQVLIEKGKYDEAEQLLGEAQEIWSRLQEPNRIDWAMTLDTLAYLCVKKGAYSDAERFLDAALQHAQQTFGHRKWLLQGVIYNSQAWLLSVREPSDLDKAEELCRKGLMLRQKVLREDSVELAWSLDNLAGILNRKGNTELAIGLNREALELRTTLLSRDHPHVAMSLKTLASLLSRDKRTYPEAIERLGEALRIVRLAKGSTHPEVAWMLRDVAQLNMLEGDLDRAEQCFEEAEQLYMGLTNDSTAARFWHLYAEFLEKRGRAPQARAIREEYLQT